MFEKQMESQLKAIFGVSKVTYDQPGDSREQECLFIEVEDAKVNIADKIQRAKVSGNLTMFGPADKLAFGFFSKAIDAASPDAVKGFFFYDFEQNTKRYQNIVQRKLGFVYFFDGQYDPELGSITSVNTTTILTDEEQQA